MTQNKITPLSEKAVSIGDIDYEDDSVSKRFFRKEDVKEFLRKLKDFIDNRTYIKIGGVRQIVFMDWEWEGFKKKFIGKELCSDDSQQPRFKQTRGGELKSDEDLHSTDNGSPADIVSKEDSEDICICGHHTKDHSYDPNKLDADLECDICDCKGFRTKEDRSFLGGYTEFWDNPEDNRWDKEEAQKQRLRWFKVGEIHQLNSFLMWLNWLIQTPKKDWEKEIKCKANQIFLNIKYEKEKSK